MARAGLEPPTPAFSVRHHIHVGLSQVRHSQTLMSNDGEMYATRAANCAARGETFRPDPLLQRLISAWPSLPLPFQTGLLAMVEAAHSHQEANPTQDDGAKIPARRPHLLPVLDYLHLQNGRVEEFWRCLLLENPHLRKLTPRTCFLCVPDESQRLRRLESLPPATPTRNESVLTDGESDVLRVLQSLNATEALTGKQILTRLQKEQTASELSTLTRRTVPGLMKKGFAVRNVRGCGYYLAERRPVS